MGVWKAASAKHLVIGIAILSAVFALGAASQANAQVDPNLQSRITTFSPPITVLTPEVNTEANSVAIEADRELSARIGKRRLGAVPAERPCDLDPWYGAGPPKLRVPRRADLLAETPRRADIAAKLHNKVFPSKVKPEYFKLPEGVLDEKKISREIQLPEIQHYLKEATPHERAEFEVLTSIYPLTFNCRAQQPQARKISFPFNPTYETNALKSSTNVNSDWSMGFGGNILFLGPGLKDRPYDIVAFNVQSASARYSDLPSKSFDTLTEQGIYQIYLGAYHSDWSPINVDYRQITNLLAIDTLSLGFVNQTAFLPGYRVETTDLFTPQLTLARQNIPLSRDICQTQPAPVLPAKPPVPGAPPPAPAIPPDLRGSCYYIDLAVTVGQTFSDVITQQNTNIAFSATPGWRIDTTNWKITLPTVATVREYDNVLGGRQDILLQVGPTASYTLPTAKGAPSLMVSLAASYNRNYSTLSTAAWHGYIIQPTLTASF